MSVASCSCTLVSPVDVECAGRPLTDAVAPNTCFCEHQAQSVFSIPCLRTPGTRQCSFNTSHCCRTMQFSMCPRCCRSSHMPQLPWGAAQHSARAFPLGRRAAATPARAAVDDARSKADDGSWPRRAQPDEMKNGSSPGRSWDDGGVTASVDDAQLAKNRETFLLRLASLGFGVRLRDAASRLQCQKCSPPQYERRPHCGPNGSQ